MQWIVITAGDRVEFAYKALTQGEGSKGNRCQAAVQASYDDDKTDEFVLLTVIEKDGKPAQLFLIRIPLYSSTSVRTVQERITRASQMMILKALRE